MRTVIFYESKTGFTKKYAEWIAEEIKGDAFPVSEVKKIDLAKYDALVFGGWTFAGSIKGWKEVKKYFESFKGKKVLFATGSTPPETAEAKVSLEKYRAEAELCSTRAFYLRGGIDYNKMHGMNKVMMKMMSAMMKKQHGEDSEEYKEVSQNFDGTDRAALKPIIEYLNG